MGLNGDKGAVGEKGLKGIFSGCNHLGIFIAV